MGTTAESVFEYITAVLEIKRDSPNALIENAVFNNLLVSEDVEPLDALRGLEILKKLGSEKVDEFRQKAAAHWPLATIF